jgi:hypothetical protein
VTALKKGLPWGRLLTEAVLIIGSVYIAIGLEGRSQDRKDAREAREALAQVRAELLQDQQDLVEIRADQERSGERYDQAIRWLSDPSSMPGDSLSRNLRLLALTNRTLYHRRSGWTTMVAAGQLADLDDPALVTVLGNLYENFSRRFEENGVGYDRDNLRVALEWVPEIWDIVDHRFRRPDQAGVLRDRLQEMRSVWNRYYLDLLTEYEERILVVIAGIEAYLERHGIDTNQ